MFHTLEEFTSAWGYEAGVTQQCLDRLTDASLGQSITPEGRTIVGS
jgi:hypothetical protein